MTTVNVIARDNGAGLSVDLQLVTRALSAQGFDVTVTALGHRSRLLGKLAYAWSRLRRRLPSASGCRHDINLMLERVQPELLGDARHNVLVPNPEWFQPAWRRWLPQIDQVLVKTHHAEALFAGLGCHTRYIGFTSHDRSDTGVPRQRQFLHLPGRSNHKGTQALLQLWRAHPHWPRLTVLWRSREAAIDPLPANVTWVCDRLDDAALRQLQNAHAFHLCPSETEGYGHYLVEALGVGAVTVTVDAPPMNELVTPERGVLCAAQASGTQALATLYRFETEAMRAAIERCIAMGDAERNTIGANARGWFEGNDRQFPLRLAAALAGLD